MFINLVPHMLFGLVMAHPGEAPVESPPADLAWEHAAQPGYRVTSPGYDLGVSEIQVDRGSASYRFRARSWADVVREDPELSALQRRTRLIVPGVTLTSIGGAWLAISTALTIDGIHADTATGALFQWGVPSALLLSGVTMAIVGGHARYRLRRERERLFVAPQLGRGGSGVVIGGRF